MYHRRHSPLWCDADADVGVGGTGTVEIAGTGNTFLNGPMTGRYRVLAELCPDIFLLLLYFVAPTNATTLPTYCLYQKPEHIFTQVAMSYLPTFRIVESNNITQLLRTIPYYLPRVFQKYSYRVLHRQSHRSNMRTNSRISEAQQMFSIGNF